MDSPFYRRIVAASATVDTDLHSNYCELDTHADTCVLGANFILLGDPTRYCCVSAFASDYGSKRLPMGTGATVYTDLATGQEYILLVSEGIFYGKKLKNSLLNPNQMRSNGIKVDDCPRQFDLKSSHSVYIPASDLSIPLEMQGVISGFQTHLPNQEELDSLPWVSLTRDVTWNPKDPHFAEAEAAASNLTVADVATVHQCGDSEDFCARYISTLSTHKCPEHFDHDCDEPESLYSRLVASVNVTLPESDPVDSVADVSALSTSGGKPTITPEDLAKKWSIGLTTARRTIQVTTQSGMRNIFVPSDRKVRLKAPFLKFPTLDIKLFADAMHSVVPAFHGEVGASVFTNGAGFDEFYPWKTKDQYSNSLMKLIQQWGIPKTLVTDGASEMQKGRGKEIADEYRVHLKVTVPYSPWQNKAEGSIRELKRFIRKKIRSKGAPKRAWAYCGRWAAALRRLTALDIPSLNGRTSVENVIGSTPDITAYILFDWYDLVYFHEPTASFPFEKRVLGRLLGVADNCEDVLAYYVMSKSGIAVIRKSVWGVPPEDYSTDAFKADQIELDEAINKRYGDHTLNKATETDQDPIGLGEMPLPLPDIFEDDEPASFVEGDPTDGNLEGYTPDTLDEYLSATLLLPHGDGMQKARVVRRARDEDDRPVGTRHPNPVLDSRLYEVEFPDGATDTVAANLIAENLFSQVDEEGVTHTALTEITDHRRTDEALPKEDGYVISHNGTKRPIITTAGWELLVGFKDGSASWVPLKQLKDTAPVDVAEYALSSKIDSEPAFNWWVKDVLRKRDRIISKVKTRYWKRTHKYGIELPHSVEEALRIDERTGTTFWRDAIEKEMKNAGLAFDFPEDGFIPPGWKEIKCHMIFDIKSTLQRKARFVAGGHLTDPPKESVFSSVVSRDSVRIAFTYAALNGLDILAGDVQNAYLNAPTKEKCWFKAGKEFGSRAGRPVKIVRALYGLRSSAARWRDHMSATLRDAGFSSCLADPDVWMRKARKPDGTRYWEYVLCYVDDVLVVSHNPKLVMEHLCSRYTMKEGSIKEPDEYLGAQVRRYTSGDQSTWAMSSDLYVKRAIADVERELKYIGQTLRNKVSTPMSSGYRPELDQSSELDPKRANYYQGLIGVLRWMVELGRVDIMVAVSMLSRYLANPRVGHLEEVFHIFAYLKRYDRSAIVFDPTTPEFDETRFAKCDWAEYYPGAHEPEPPNAPELLGETMTMSCFVDADHAGCRETRRSHTGIIIFLQRTPIIWYSKRQNTVESSTFGSEFVAMKTAVEQVEGLRYKLRMMGIPLDGATNVFCDNESVFKNSTHPESVLKKKHNAICYHRTREAIAAGIIRVAWEDGRFNIADVLTKLLPGPRLRELIACILD